MHQDYFSVLSETARLAAIALDAVRVHELGAEQWSVAMTAAALAAAGDETKNEDLQRAYTVFAQKNLPPVRAASLARLARFVAANQGNGWLAFLPYALYDSEPILRRKAAVYVATMAPATQDIRFTGVAHLVRVLSTDELAPVTLLDALLSLGDVRFLPQLQQLYAVEPQCISLWLDSMDVAPNHLSCQWLLGLLEAQPSLARHVVQAWVRTVPKVATVIDLTLPVPTWAFKSATPQPLHGWSPNEYFDRMLSRLSPYLTEPQLCTLREVFVSQA